MPDPAALVLVAASMVADARCLERAGEDARRLDAAGLLRADARAAAAELLARRCRTVGDEDEGGHTRVFGIELQRADDDSPGHKRLTKRR